jgi:hypothetical protein
MSSHDNKCTAFVSFVRCIILFEDLSNVHRRKEANVIKHKKESIDEL